MKENILKMLIRLLSKVSHVLKAQRELKNPNTVRRIVVLQMSGIGDLLLITPALRALYQLYPSAKIDIITYKLKNAEFLFRFPYIRNGCEFPLFDIELKRKAYMESVILADAKQAGSFHKKSTGLMNIFCGGEKEASIFYNDWSKKKWFRFAVKKVRGFKEFISGCIFKDYDVVIVIARKS